MFKGEFDWKPDAVKLESALIVTNDEKCLPDAVFGDQQGLSFVVASTSSHKENSVVLQGDFPIKLQPDFTESKIIKGETHVSNFLKLDAESETKYTLLKNTPTQHIWETEKNLHLEILNNRSTVESAMGDQIDIKVVERSDIKPEALSPEQFSGMQDSELDSKNVLSTFYSEGSCLSPELNIAGTLKQERSEIPIDSMELLSLKTEFKTGLDKQNEKLFGCQQCSALFRRKNLLKKHLEIHSEKRRFSCKQCPFRSNCKKDFNRHLNIHTDLRPFVCGQCPARFRRQAHLKEHLRRVHSDAKPFSCEQCLSGFKSKFELKKHASVHCDEKHFFCKVCSAGFKTESNCKRHIKRIHSVKRPLSCDQCPARFSTRDALREHFRTHSFERPFICNLCKLKFREKCKLTRHLLVHSSEKGFSCDHCSMQFNQKYNLKAHILTHSNKQTFSCKECCAT